VREGEREIEKEKEMGGRGACAARKERMCWRSERWREQRERERERERDANPTNRRRRSPNSVRRRNQPPGHGVHKPAEKPTHTKPTNIAHFDVDVAFDLDEHEVLVERQLLADAELLHLLELALAGRDLLHRLRDERRVLLLAEPVLERGEPGDLALGVRERFFFSKRQNVFRNKFEQNKFDARGTYARVRICWGEIGLQITILLLSSPKRAGERERERENLSGVDFPPKPQNPTPDARRRRVYFLVDL